MRLSIIRIMPFPELNKNDGFRQFRGVPVLLDIYFWTPLPSSIFYPFFRIYLTIYILEAKFQDLMEK